MTNIASTTIVATGVLEDASRFKTFGFVMTNAGKIHLPANQLKRDGFKPKGFTAETSFEVEAEMAPKGLLATRVITIDGKTADKMKSVADVAEPAPKKARTVTRSLKKRAKKVELPAPAAPKPVTLDLFCNPSQKLDCNKQTGECIYSIRTKNGDFVQYVVVKDGIVIRQLGPISLAEARADIGKVIRHPVDPNAGKATNDPAVSQAMAAGNSGKKGKAA